MVLEHITTKYAVDYVRQNAPTIGATVTPHHLLYSRSALFEGGLRPHRYCLPLPQREEHRLSLVEAVTSGASCFFAGTDSAPHIRHDKESACGCAGVFNAPVALAVYADIFERQNKLQHLERFVSCNGADFYKLPYNQEKILLKRLPQEVPLSLGGDDMDIVPLLAGETLQWSITEGITYGDDDCR